MAGEAPRRGQSDDQPEAREGQAGRFGVAEGFVVPVKLGNAGGGKGPQFKTDAIRGEGPSVLALTEDSQIVETVRVCADEDAGMHLAVS